MARAQKKATKKKPSKRRVKNPTQRTDTWIKREYGSGQMHFEDSEIHGGVFVGSDLRSAVFTNSKITVSNFEDAELFNVDLRHCDISRCSFRGAEMGESMLSRAYVRNSDFVGADLNGADLEAASFEDTRFMGANLPLAVLRGAVIKRGELDDVVLTSAKLSKCQLSNLTAMRMDAEMSDWTGARIIEVAFSYSKMDECNLEGAYVEDSTFEETELDAVSLGNAKFIRCVFKRTGLTASVGYGSTFVECEFESTDLEDTNLSDSIFTDSGFLSIKADGLNLSGSYLQGAHFLHCDLSKANLKNAHVDGATFMSSPMSDETLAHIDLSVAKLVDEDTMKRWRVIKQGAAPVDERGRAIEIGSAALQDRDDENLAWSMEHQTPGVGDEERAARWRDEDVDVSGAQPPAELMGAAEETDDALRAWMQPGIKQKLGVWNPKKSLPWKRLITRCQKLWEAYDEKPLKKNLVAFGAHIEKMKASKSVRVKTEANRARRSYNKEMKARGWKAPKKAKKKAAKKKAKKKAPKKKASKRRAATRNPAVSTAAEIISAYKGGERDFDDSNLSSANLDGVNLDGIHAFRGAFVGAAMKHVRLRDAEVLEGNFRSTDLYGAELNNSYFNDSNFRGAQLQGVDATEAVFTGSKFKGATLQNGKFAQAKFNYVIFEDSDAGRADFANAEFFGATFDDVDLSLTDCRGANFRDASFVRTDLGGAKFAGANFAGAYFGAISWTNVDLRGTKNVDPAALKEWSQHTGLTMGQSAPIVPRAPVAPVPHVVRPRGRGRTPQQVRASIAAQAAQSTGWSYGARATAPFQVVETGDGWAVVFEPASGVSLHGPWVPIEFTGTDAREKAITKARILNNKAGVEELRSDLGPEAYEEGALDRDYENLRFSMEHQVPGVADEEAAARWRDEEIDEDSPEWVKRGMTFEEWMRTSNPKKKRGRKKKATKRKARKKK